jgi:hypothetical protein
MSAHTFSFGGDVAAIQADREDHQHYVLSLPSLAVASSRDRPFWVRRNKGSKDTVHTLEPDTARALRRAREEQEELLRLIGTLIERSDRATEGGSLPPRCECTPIPTRRAISVRCMPPSPALRGSHSQCRGFQKRRDRTHKRLHQFLRQSWRAL